MNEAQIIQRDDGAWQFRASFLTFDSMLMRRRHNSCFCDRTVYSLRHENVPVAVAHQIAFYNRKIVQQQNMLLAQNLLIVPLPLKSNSSPLSTIPPSPLRTTGVQTENNKYISHPGVVRSCSNGFNVVFWSGRCRPKQALRKNRLQKKINDFKTVLFFHVEPPKTFGLGNRTGTSVVNMSRARVGSRQNGVTGRTTGRVV